MRNLAVILFVAGCGVSVSGEPGNPTNPTNPPTPAIPTTPTVHDAEIEIGACEGTVYRSATTDTGGADPGVWVEVDARRMVVHLEDRAVNCCPSPAATFALTGSDVVFTFESETSTDVCDCACLMDFVATSEPFDAGTYTLDVSYNGARQGTFEIVVP